MPAKKSNKVEVKKEAPKPQPKAPPKMAERSGLDAQIAALDVELANPRLTVFKRQMAERQRSALIQIRDSE